MLECAYLMLVALGYAPAMLARFSDAMVEDFRVARLDSCDFMTDNECRAEPSALSASVGQTWLGSGKPTLVLPT